MNKKEAAIHVFENGGCDNFDCDNCPLYEWPTANCENELELAESMVAEKTSKEQELGTLITEALNSTDFINKVAEAVRNMDIEAADTKEEAEPDYPYVGIAEDLWDNQINIFTEKNKGMCLKHDIIKYIGDSSDNFAENCFKPFTGTITYKNGKPVETKVSK